MPKLPDKSQLGQPASFRSGRDVISRSDAMADTSGVGVMNRVVGRGLKELGNVGADILAKQQQEADALDLIKADAYRKKNMVDLEVALMDDPDYASYEEKFDKSAGHIHQQAGQLIRNPKLREKYLLRAQEEVITPRTRVMGRGRDLDKQAKTVGIEDAIQNHISIYTDPRSDAGRKSQARADIEAAITLAERTGLVDPKNAAKWREKYVRGAVLSDAQTQALTDPDGLAKDLRGRSFEETLVASESSGRQDIVTDLGYAGLYQFGAERLADLGFYTKGSGERFGKKGWGGDKWSGSFAIPGFPEVTSLPEFLANPDAQRAAFEAHVKRMDAEIKSNKLDAYVGQKIGGVEITHDGLRAMLHLGSVGSTKRALESDGIDNPADANGTTVLEYARRAAPAGRYADLMPEERAALLKRAEGERDRRLEANREELKRMLADDVESIRDTGQGVEGYDLELATKVLEPNQIATHLLDRKRAQMQYEATHDLGVLSNKAIERRLTEVKPKAGEQGYADKAWVYDKAIASARRILEERENDPAAAADRTEEVQRLLAQPSDVEGVAVAEPSTEQIIEARLKAQEAFGLPRGLQRPITRAEAKGIMRALAGLDQKEITEGLREGKGAWIDVVNEVEATYGRYAKDALAAAIEMDIKDASRAEFMSDLLRKVARDGRLQARDLQPLMELDRIDRESLFAEPFTRSFSRREGRFAPYAETESAGTLVVPPQFKAGGPSPLPIPNDRHIAKLRQDPTPEMIDAFDKKFGAGAAAQVLGGDQ